MAHRIQKNSLLIRLPVHYKRIYNQGTARWKRCIKQGMEKSTQNFHVLSGHTTLPAPPCVQPPAPFSSPEIWVRWKVPTLSSPGWFPWQPSPILKVPRSPVPLVISLAYRKTPITLEISGVFRSCVACSNETLVMEIWISSSIHVSWNILLLIFIQPFNYAKAILSSRAGQKQQQVGFGPQAMVFKLYFQGSWVSGVLLSGGLALSDPPRPGSVRASPPQPEPPLTHLFLFSLLFSLLVAVWPCLHFLINLFLIRLGKVLSLALQKYTVFIWE